jgi:hypothetical protein
MTELTDVPHVLPLLTQTTLHEQLHLGWPAWQFAPLRQAQGMKGPIAATALYCRVAEEQVTYRCSAQTHLESGIVNQDVDLAILVHRLVDDALAVCLAGDVA